MGNMVFGSRVKQLRKKAGLTMEELAAKLNVTKSRVNMWENKGVVPRQDALTRIASEFRVSIDYLLGNDGNLAASRENPKLEYLQRGLKKMDERELEKAELLLTTMFEDIFNDEEEHEGI